jgi:fumarate hydratase class II
MATFDAYCVSGVEANRARIEELVGRSLMLVTALVPHIGSTLLLLGAQVIAEYERLDPDTSGPDLRTEGD